MLSKYLNYFITALVIYFLYLLLAFNENSIFTSLVFLGGEHAYTIWLLELFYLKISDFLIIFLSIFAIFYTLKNKIIFHKYFIIILVYIIYFFIGAVYNLFVSDHLKGFLYDIKASLFIFVPFVLLLNLNKDNILTKYLTLEVIFILCFIGGLMDSIYINRHFEHEFPQKLNFPVVRDFIIVILPFGISLLQKKIILRTFWLLICFLIVLSDINRGNLGPIYTNFVIIVLGLIFIFFDKKYISSIIFYLGYLLVLIVLPIFIIGVVKSI